MGEWLRWIRRGQSTCINWQSTRAVFRRIHRFSRASTKLRWCPISDCRNSVPNTGFHRGGKSAWNGQSNNWLTQPWDYACICFVPLHGILQWLCIRSINGYLRTTAFHSPARTGVVSRRSVCALVFNTSLKFMLFFSRRKPRWTEDRCFWGRYVVLVCLLSSSCYLSYNKAFTVSFLSPKSLLSNPEVLQLSIVSASKIYI